MNRCPRTTVAALMLLASIVTAGASLRAQTDYSNRRATSYLTVGAGFAPGASMTLSPPDGSKVGPIFAYQITAQTAYPLSPSISAMLNLGYDSRGTRLKNQANTEIYGDEHVGYFMINPGFSFSSFYIGMNFGFPLSASTTSSDGTSAPLSDNQFSLVQTMLEPQIGAVVQLMNNKSGWLGLSVIGGITLNEISDRGSSIASDAGDFHMVSLHLGLFYQFSIPGTGK